MMRSMDKLPAQAKSAGRALAWLLLVTCCSAVWAQESATTPADSTAVQEDPLAKLLPPEEEAVQPAIDPLLATRAPFTMNETEYGRIISDSLIEKVEEQVYPVTVGAFEKTVSGVKVSGWLARPEATTPTLAVVMVHDWWGLGQEIRQEAETIASKGCLALAVDLYDGRMPADRREAARTMRELDRDLTLRRLQAAHAWLAAQGAGGPLGVGVIGYSLGAKLARLTATAEPRPIGVALFHGGVTRDAQALAAIHSPLIGFFARNDPHLTPDRVESFETALKTNSDAHRIYLYQTEPGFALRPLNDRDRRYADNARGRTLEFFERQLRGVSAPRGATTADTTPPAAPAAPPADSR